jgi:hypothetical protein
MCESVEPFYMQSSPTADSKVSERPSQSIRLLVRIREAILDLQIAKALPVLQVLGIQNAATGLDGRTFRTLHWKALPMLASL